MQAEAESAPSRRTPRTVELPRPPAQLALTAVEVHAGAPIKPKQRIGLFSSAEWEEFIYEWADSLDSYTKMELIAGSGDAGIDIAGFRTRMGFEGAWDCYQCKHYSKAINWSDLRPELTKVFRNAVEADFMIPENYYVVAPHGCSTSLTLLINKPAKLKSTYLADLRAGKVDLPSAENESVVQLATHFDFSIFQSVDLSRILREHAESPYHQSRFGGGLPRRPPADLPPDDPSLHEARYISQLLSIYSEKYGEHFSGPTDAALHAKTKVHYSRQREAFYSAEALKAFARDQVPDGTFESLQEEIFDGVIETHDRDHKCGIDCLASVLEAAAAFGGTSNALLTVWLARDRKGICHQLANDDRLIWLAGERTQ